MTKIKALQNGPFLVEDDDVSVLDWNGVEYSVARSPVALCRCGASENKPFCDGSHSKSGFSGGEPAKSSSNE
jgi:CDGSH-type Zn-finger protein